LFKGIRGRLISYFSIIIVVIVIIMGTFFIWFLNYFYLQTLQENLHSQARIASALILEMLEHDASPGDLDAALKSLGTELGVRLTLIADDGEVLADSAENPIIMENHLNRPEVLAAINYGKGVAKRYSSTISEEMYYLAIPLKVPDEPGVAGLNQPAVIRLALPLIAINRAIFNLMLFILIAFVVSVLLAFFPALLLSGRLTGSIRQIRSAAQAIEEGNYQPELVVPGDDELSELAAKITRMGLNLKLRMEQVLGEKSKLEKVIDSMSSGIILLDCELRVELINPAGEKLFEVSREEAVGLPLQKVIRNYTLHENLRSLQQDGKAKMIELNAYYPRSAVLETYLLPVSGPDDKMIGILLLFHEVTEIRSLEKMRSDFVANISHELRTPLTAIRGYTETIIHEELSAGQQRSFLEIIDRETRRLSDLLDDLLDLAQIENEKGFVKKEPVDMVKLISDAVDRVNRLGRKEDTIISVDLPKLVLIVSGNFEWLSQALVNILENSIRHGKKGGEVMITLKSIDQNAVISIKDNGPGIPETDLPHIFERFYRVDKARSRKSGGTGLGLSIVKHILEAHGAQYSLQSREGEGTIFSFSLPLRHPS
jgi:two-component system, OmpR family, phosphate regulon sensor histidine kinase PhoR